MFYFSQHPGDCRCRLCMYGVQPPKPWPRDPKAGVDCPCISGGACYNRACHDDGCQATGRKQEPIPKFGPPQGFIIPAPYRDETAELRGENDALKKQVDRLRKNWHRGHEIAKRDFDKYAQHTAPCPGTPCSCGLTLTRATRGYSL